MSAVPAIDVNRYSPPIAEWIAGRYASGEPETSLADLHRADPEHIPAPLYVRRWRKERPAFDALMIEAEQCRAEALFDQCLGVADDPHLVAASARVATDVRFRMAESLDSGRYGKKVELSARLSWDQLVAQSLETVRVDREPIEHEEQAGRIAEASPAESAEEGGTPKDAADARATVPSLLKNPAEEILDSVPVRMDTDGVVILSKPVESATVAVRYPSGDVVVTVPEKFFDAPGEFRGLMLAGPDDASEGF